jgi:DNA-binding transcriptional MerR regulator
VSTAIPPIITIGAAARRLRRPLWQVRRLYERGLLPPAARVGPYRVIAEADLPRVEQALRKAGYLPQEAGTNG